MELYSGYNAIANTASTTGGQRVNTKYKPVALFEYSDRTSEILLIAGYTMYSISIIKYQQVQHRISNIVR